MSPEGLRFTAAAVGVMLIGAGLAKLFSSASVAPFLSELGVRPSLAKRLAGPVPAVEIALGVGLLTGLALWAVSLVALAVCALFFAVQLVGVARGGGTSCRCFGALDAGRSRVLPVIRAGLLLAAALAVASGALSGVRAVRGVSLEVVALGAAAGVGTLLAFALLSQVQDFERWRPRPGPNATDLGYR